MITQTVWITDSVDNIQVKFVEDKSTGYSVMLFNQDGTYSVFDKLHTNDDQPLYHDSKLFSNEDEAICYAITQLS